MTGAIVIGRGHTRRPGAARRGRGLATRLALLAPLAAAGCVAPTPAAPPAARDLRQQEEHEAGHEAEHEGHGPGTQALNLFAGGSREIGDLDGWTLGVDYEYRLSERWGVGGYAEVVSGLDRSFTVGAQLYWHAVADLVLVTGPGVERHHDEWRPTLRIGGFYEIPLGAGWVISPAVFYDITESENFWVYGLNLGYLW